MKLRSLLYSAGKDLHRACCTFAPSGRKVTNIDNVGLDSAAHAALNVSPSLKEMYWDVSESVLKMQDLQNMPS